MTDQQSKIKRAKYIALAGYLGLIALIPAWHLWLAPPMDGLSKWFVLALWGIPLLIPFKGLITGKPYTYAWANFIAMLYFLHSLTLVYASESERFLAIIEFILVSLWFGAGTYYARWQGQYLGIGIKKRKNTNSPNSPN
ncbi:DUF2069 domain-containing protein [Catenovulum sediminis]|uniref:DUF2069 domain-containing protein n=1 Tax=Catenovulum sediminis TaxID=1740262 RepID=A0ABV1RM54_9ALTE|nr:DUF2069 domain-containing protein [Catenovulum sediminis]